MNKKLILSLCMIHFYFFNNNLSLLSLSPPHSFEDNLHQELNETSIEPPPAYDLIDSQPINDPPPPYIEFDPQMDGFSPNETIINPYSIDFDINRYSIQNLIDQNIDPDSPEGRRIILEERLSRMELPEQERRNSPSQRNERQSRIDPTEQERRNSPSQRNWESRRNELNWYDKLSNLEKTMEFLTSPIRNQKWWSTITVSIRTYLFIFMSQPFQSLTYSVFLLIAFLIILIAFFEKNFSFGLVLSFSIFVCLLMMLLSMIYYRGFKKIYLDITFLKIVPLIIKDCLFIFFFFFSPFLLIYFSIPYSLLIPICILAFLIYSLCFFYKEYQHHKLNNKKINFIKSFLKIPLDFIVMIWVSICSLMSGLMTIAALTNGYQYAL